METLQTLTTVVTIVSIVFGILNIILFFKIWNMTDNVKQILNIIENSHCYDAEFKKEMDEIGEVSNEYEFDDEEIADSKRNNTLLIIAIVIVVGMILLTVI